ncbi:plasmodesmata-located protein 3 [Cajanus cajan]|nr:plasmodesmata-located protein 3 [Cajanus cajan]
MDISHSTILFTLPFFLFLLPSSKPVSDYSTLVYKTCATQTSKNHQPFQTYSQTLNSLFQQLIAQSSQHKFFKTMEAVTDDTAISGLFQCREDISKEDCFSCVSTLPHMSNTLCGDSMSARVQLHGCYIHYVYESEEVPETGGESDESSILLHKDCGEAVGDYMGFKGLMDEAFVALESGILNSNGFYITNYKSVKLMAQCEGDSDTCDCSNCVNDALQVAKEQCATSRSAQIYLHKCFISYAMHGNPVPGTSRNINTEKLAAIIVGGAAALFLGFIFLSLLNSRFRKDDYE